MQDSIERQITIHAPRERVYSAIADPAKVTQWFPTTIEGSYTVGSQPVFGFGEHGRNQILVVAADPHEYFAFRWVPGANQYLGDVQAVATTLVEFRLSEQEEGICTVTLTESGFSDLPEQNREPAFQQNSGGWDFMLGRLEQQFPVAVNG